MPDISVCPESRDGDVCPFCQNCQARICSDNHDNETCFMGCSKNWTGVTCNGMCSDRSSYLGMHDKLFLVHYALFMPEQLYNVNDL